MNITLKLKYTELQSLVAHLEGVLNMGDSMTMKDGIVALLMLRFYRRLHKQTALVEPRKYTFSIPPEEAMAFIIYFQNWPVNPVSHAGNLILQMVSQFDKQTTTFHLC